MACDASPPPHHPPAACPPCLAADGPQLSRQDTRAATSAKVSTDSPGFSRAFPQAETAAAFPPAGHDQLDLDALLSPGEKALRDKVRAFMVRKPW